MATTQTAAYQAYLAYLAASETFWQENGGLAPGAKLDPKAFGPAYQFDSGLSAATYTNMAAAVRDQITAHRTGVNPGINASPPPQPAATSGVPAAVVARTYGTVDNGVSSLAEYGFGQNRYTQGAPVGGYQTGVITPQRRPGPMQNVTTTATGTTSGTAPAPGSASTAGLSTAQRDAWAYLKGILDQYGLGSLSQFVITELTAGRSQEEIALDLQQTPEFKTAFPEIAQRQAAGLPPISPGEIVSYRNQAIQMMRAAGLPKGFYDSPQDLQTLIGNDVSLNELNDRIQSAKDATYNIDPAMQARLWQEFGLAPGSGDLAAYFLDDQRALPILQRQLQAAKIGGVADETGYAGLNNSTALDLAQAGVTDSQARQGFATLGHEKELFTGLPGENADTIGQGAQLAATFLGNTGANERIERRRRARTAAFADGGGYASTQKGIGGLGASDQQ